MVQPDVVGWETGGQRCAVVRSGEGHLSVWPAERDLPDGWTAVGVEDDYRGCLAAVEDLAQSPAGAFAACDPARCPHRPSILDLVAEAVRQHADRFAVIEAECRLTYRELARKSDALAAALRGRGVGDGDRVAVYLPRGVDVFVAILAILKAGAAYVPVDTRYPDARRDLMIHNSGARLVISAPELRAGLVGVGSAVVTVAELTSITSSEGTTEGRPVHAGCQAACVLFTSGSSGVPKAIVLEHRNLAYFAANPALPAIGPDDRVAHVSSLSFDAFNYEAWCALASGAAIVVLPTLPDLIARDPRGELRRHGITAMLAPTMAVNHIAQEDPDAFTGIRILHTGGDVVSPAACRQLLASSFAGSFFNLYGPTEGTTACTAYGISAVGPDETSVPIGTPLTGAHVYLLDPDRRPVADGEVGELFIGGAGVARGYLGQPALTAARFLPDPFAMAGQRMYATGDLARRRADGVLEFVGRSDDQVKIRGYRVEPREVERVLGRFEGVRDIAVVVSGEGDGKHLVALVAVDPGVSLRELRGHAAELLPDYLVPTAFAAVAAIPANDHGKRDTARLLAMAREELRRRRDIVAPRDDVERYLARVWEELLGVEEVGVNDDFSALGGNSLLAFRLRRRITTDLGLAIEVRDAVAVTVLGQLADLLRAQRSTPVP
ncbi:amino acid adenylation domain-containing protein [Micromonospora sp. FIMYZ51]|uniref:amino acid adenylation domain-containing protein n=1 Tax=Micromonospora sp. FIMYZ51 TaxID=3051832 RepID=UPI00311E6384